MNSLCSLLVVAVNSSVKEGFGPTTSGGSLGRWGSAAASWYSLTQPTDWEKAGIGAVASRGTSESSVSPSGTLVVAASHSGGGGGGGGAEVDGGTLVGGGSGGAYGEECCLGVNTILDLAVEWCGSERVRLRSLNVLELWRALKLRLG